MAVRPDVVEYFKQNLAKFQVDVLRRQLLAEGVPLDDLEDSLSEALRAPKEAAAGGGERKARLKAALIALGAGIACLALLVVLAKRRSSKPAQAEGNTQGPTGESAFIGHRGWIVRLPPDYVGMAEFKDAQKRHQVVYFCKKDTDPTSFVDEGLYGQLGIVRLDVVPSEFPSNPTGLANLSRAASAKYQKAGEKFTIKNIQVSTLPGVQVNVQAPFPRVEAYVLGADDIYYFYGGEESEVWRDILLSLRDPRSEN